MAIVEQTELNNTELNNTELNNTELNNTELSDCELLCEFAQSKCQESFTDVVKRHGGLVMGVCRRLLPRLQDAEDAFQTTFLVLARKASSITWQNDIGPWLYTTATSVCRNFRRRIINRRETDWSGMDVEDQSLEDVANQDLREIFDEELSRMPKQYRDPLVLFHLEGKSRDDIATLLGLTLAAVKTRLERGRKKLRVRMALRGAPLVAAALLVQQSQAAAAGLVGSTLIETTAATAAGASCSSTILQLVTQEIQAMTYYSLVTKTLMVGTAATCLLGITAFSGGLGFAPGEATGQQPTAVVLPDVMIDANPKPVETVSFVDEAATAVRKPRRSPKMIGQSNAVERIQSALDDVTTIEFVETQLSDVVRYLSELHNIPIRLDQRALDQEGLTGGLPITLEMKNVAFRSSLRLLLRQNELTYTITDDVLLITTEASEHRYDQVWVHDVANWDVHEAAKMVNDFFVESGSKVSCYVRKETLIVKASLRCQEDIAKFFSDLAEFDREN